jgi:hypothetical protein
VSRAIRSSNPDIRGSFAALKRAAVAARKLAKATGTPFITVKDGRVIDLNAKPKRKPRPLTPARKRPS